MGDRLKGRVAIVTGSGQGIGRAIAIAMAKEGAKVVTNNRKPGSTGLSPFGEDIAQHFTPEERELARSLSGDAATVAKEIVDMGGEAVGFFGDVGDFKTAGRLVQTAIDTFGSVDILVNNATAFRGGAIWELSEEDWDAVVISKLKGAFNCIRHAVGPMKEQRWGRILNCSAITWRGGGGQPGYVAANAGLVGLTGAVAASLYEYGITCNAFTPHAMTRAVLSGRAGRRTRGEARESGRRPPIVSDDAFKPAEGLAPFIVYLATEEAANISGTVFDAGSTGEYGIYSEPEITRVIKKEAGLWTVDELVETVPATLLQGYKSRAIPTPSSK